MVSAAKYARAERELKPARVYGTGALALYEKAEIKAPEDKKKHLLIGVSSDRESLSIYDDIDADVLRNYQEFTLANILYYSLKESTTSEQSARMTAMDNASKNASEMIDKLTLTFNRTRQAVITKELIEIISGAAAL
ncbi:atp synthase subunit mitochondrial isoform x2 [Limosa lapponica baueri]|uniref:ATP synthase F(1) complex subunit gamma, mitochondrial n=1 Tax=Limosa lapponica baueri TaxID=1758121 RepID=A0A2I0T2W2_LIMLA|nr:atp synthase subunit mitochondrial isoform x2 [Limosa lapponica baueri]